MPIHIQKRVQKYSRNAGLVLIFLFFLLGGVSHFTSTAMFVSIMPPYVPFHLEVVYLTGVLEVGAALCLLFAKVRVWTGNFLFIFTIAVTPANIHMWLHPELFPTIDPLFLSVRLVGQVALLAIIWYSTRVPRNNESVTQMS